MRFKNVPDVIRNPHGDVIIKIVVRAGHKSIHNNSPAQKWTRVASIAFRRKHLLVLREEVGNNLTFLLSHVRDVIGNGLLGGPNTLTTSYPSMNWKETKRR